MEGERREGEQREDEGFLPPEPPGPEPDLGGSAAPQEPPTQPLPPQQPTPPQPGQQPGYSPPPPPPPPGYAYPPPPGYGQPPPAYPPPPAPGPPYAYPSQPREPDNGAAVAGFVLAMVCAFLWLTFLGFPLLGVVLAVFALVYSRKGKRKVESGETRKHGGLAQAGWITSIIMLVLTSLSTLAWLAVLILAITSEDFRQGFDENNQDNPFQTPSRAGAVLTLASAALRLIA